MSEQKIVNNPYAIIRCEISPQKYVVTIFDNGTYIQEYENSDYSTIVQFLVKNKIQDIRWE